MISDRITLRILLAALSAFLHDTRFWRTANLHYTFLHEHGNGVGYGCIFVLVKNHGTVDVGVSYDMTLAGSLCL
jgi:hypothetical protein